MTTEPDIFTKLAHDVLHARHNGTTEAHALATHFFLVGVLTTQPHVALMTETPWDKVSQVAISPEGRIAVLGIERDGRKEIVEWQVIDRRWTCRVIDSTGAEMHVDHLHYPEGSEEVAFTVTKPNGETRVFWDDWSFDAADETTGKIVHIYCYYDGDIDWLNCLTVYSRGEKQVVGYFRKGDEATGLQHNALARIKGQKLKILGRTAKGQIIILATIGQGKQTLFLVNHTCSEVWQSDEYDQILENSVMEREGGISFVGWLDQTPEGEDTITGEAFLITSSSRQSLGAVYMIEQVHCLPSGRILIEERREGKTVALRDVRSNDRIELAGVSEINEIVEIPSSLVICTSTNCTTWDLRVVHENQVLSNIVTKDAVLNLRRWGDHLVLQGDGRLLVIDVDDFEEWLKKKDDRTYPLYTPFAHLVPTNEGILAWHFVGGTFYVIRYEM